METKDRIVVALDVPNLQTARPIIEELGPYVGFFKVGSELATAEGVPKVVKFIHGVGGRVVLDLKYHDTPNTMRRSALVASELGVEMFTIHASAGSDAVRQAVENKGECKVLGVTVLTSLDDDTCMRIYKMYPVPQVLEFSHILNEEGVDGIICSPNELMSLAFYSKFDSMLKMTPGIRPKWFLGGDQKRMMTPKEALKAGADYLFIGRPILCAPETIGSPSEAVQKIIEEIDGVANESRSLT